MGLRLTQQSRVREDGFLGFKFFLSGSKAGGASWVRDYLQKTNRLSPCKQPRYFGGCEGYRAFLGAEGAEVEC